MALKPLPARELAGTLTLFESFMGHVEERHKTVGQLLSIYRERSKRIHAAALQNDHLRVDRFMDDMANDRWREEVVVRIGVFDHTVFVIDGIHRGIAYLGCIAEGISPTRLPALCVER